MAKQENVFEIPARVVDVADRLMAARKGWSGPIGMTMTQGQSEGGAEGGGTDEGAGLLDDEAENGGNGDESTGGEQGVGSGLAGETPAEMEARLTARFESEIDRRVNSAVQTVTRRFQQGSQGGGNAGSGGGSGDGGDGGDGGQQSGGSTGSVSASDAREARMVYREAVTDEIKFLGNEEREFALGLAQGMVRDRLNSGEDPEAAGMQVAKEVAKQIKTMRGHYEKKVLSALRRQGLISEDGRGPGQPLAGSSAPGSESGFKKGADRAQTMYADRIPQKQS